LRLLRDSESTCLSVACEKELAILSRYPYARSLAKYERARAIFIIALLSSSLRELILTSDAIIPPHGYVLVEGV
jgi:hypothetical protein